MAIYMGTSGYYYPARIGRFYPLHVPRAERLRYYAERFNALEINSTFYKIPTVKSLQKRHDITSADFTFVVKVVQTITHEKKLENIRDDLAHFIDVIEGGLKEKVHCFLFQLPPSFHYNEENLARVMAIDPHTSIDYAFEFRHKSRWRDDVIQALHEKGFIFCSISHPTLPNTLISSEKQYLRLHGVPELYKSPYGKEGLKPFIEHITKSPSAKFYIFFNNTRFGDALDDMLLMQQEKKLFP